MTITQAIATVLHATKTAQDRNRYRSLTFRRSSWHHQDALRLSGPEHEIVATDDPGLSLTLIAEDLMANDWEVSSMASMRLAASRSS